MTEHHHRSITIYDDPLPVDRVIEQGRRVHAWQLRHDLNVNVLGDFAGYWDDAQHAGRRQRGDR